MKGYFMLCGKDAAEFPDHVFMSVYGAIKSTESFIGFELSGSYCLQMRPSKEKKGWYVELLNTELLNFRWTTMSRRNAQSLLKATLNSSRPVQFMEKESVDWKQEILCVDDEGHVSV